MQRRGERAAAARVAFSCLNGWSPPSPPPTSPLLLPLLLLLQFPLPLSLLFLSPFPAPSPAPSPYLPLPLIFFCPSPAPSPFPFSSSSPIPYASLYDNWALQQGRHCCGDGIWITKLFFSPSPSRGGFYYWEDLKFRTAVMTKLSWNLEINPKPA